MKLGLRARLILILCGTTALPLALSLTFQDQALSRSVNRAASLRIEGSARSAERLLESHLSALRDEYRAVSGTPQFRANLEVEDPPTLTHYASDLRRRHSASRIVFLGADERLWAASGDETLDREALRADGDRLIASDGRPFAVVSVPITSGGEPLGRLVAVEPLTDTTIAEWSALCGAEVWFRDSAAAASADLTAVVRNLRGLRMGVTSRDHVELRALEQSRTNLLRGGAAALFVALLASLALSRKLTLPIQELQAVAQRIGRGDFDARATTARSDELGSLSHAVNEMAERLTDQTQELTRQMNRAENASRAKSSFLANISHELRTPLTAILGYTEFLREVERLSAEERGWVTTVLHNGQQLLELLDDVLDISRIEAGTLEVARQACAVQSILQGVVDLWRPSAQRAEVALELSAADTLPETIQTDPVRLRQILTNLIGNAIKFTEAGGSVRVLASAETADDARTLVSFEVIDTGIGIAPEDRARLFKSFAQADVSSTRRFGGAGLGLAICKRLVELLGGTITLESEVGRGSRFRVTIDAGEPEPTAARAEAKPAASEPATAEARGNVLLAEDCPDNRRLVTMILRKAGVDVDSAEDGEQALRQGLLALESGRLYDVILMDMQMPKLDGYEATRQLRREGYTGVIIALTAHTMAGDREKCLDAGCDEFLAKPVDRQKLIDTVAIHSSDAKPPADSD